MALAAAPLFRSTKETTNYARLCRLLVDVSTHILRETFDKKRPPGNLDMVLSSPPVRALLQLLKSRKVLNPSQWGRLYPSIKSSVSSKNFDITLLMVLLRNICSLHPPPTGWDKFPPATDTTLEADIVRIKCYRNAVYGHASQASVDDAKFNQYWQDIQDALVRLGGAGYQGAIDELKKECMDPDFEEHYKELLKQWVMDEDSMKKTLDEIKADLNDLKQFMIKPEKKTGLEGVAEYTNALKDSIKSQTKFLTVASPTSSKVRIDDTYTSLLIQHGRKQVEDFDLEREKHLQQYGQVRGKPVKHCQEIFASDTDCEEEKNPKTVLVTGKAGIGKTLFCQKLIRDWADNKLFQSQTNSVKLPDFKFAFLLTFRQLNLLGDDSVTLKDILIRSSVLDDNSNIDDSLFEYIVHHSEEVLIILDGFDECSKQSFIASNLDEQYPNIAQEEMPVAALCAKLIKGKILKDSFVMITSRSDESDDIKDKIGFDRCVEITGFSEQQVKEYIEKYFKENEVMKKAVMDHITKNENLVSFAHIPVLCFLMCSYFEYVWQKSMKTDDLPVNASDIYFEVVHMFFKNHSKTKEIPLEATMEKLSILAAQLLREKKYLFAVEDMKTLTPEEVENLRASGLLHCGPMFRKSFSEMTKYFYFTHLTLQEYLAAHWFVKQKKIPSGENASAMVLQFMSGILSKQNDKAFMEQLIERLHQRSSAKHPAGLVMMKCLAEYKNVKFAQNVVKKYYRDFCDRDGKIKFLHLTDVDCIALCFLLDVINTLNLFQMSARSQSSSQLTRTPSGNRRYLHRRVTPNAEETSRRVQTSSHRSCWAPVEQLTLFNCQMTQTGLRKICEALKKRLCTITSLLLSECNLTEDCIATIAESLPSTKLIELSLKGARIADAGVVSLCQALQKATTRKVVEKLNLSGNQITDDGVVSLCQALQTEKCKVTELNMSGNQITDTGVASLCEALQTSTCKVTTLYLGCNQITNAGVASLSKALQTETCRVTALYLGRNQITDAGVVSLSEALQTETCKVTTLSLERNQITDAGVARLCQPLRTTTCKVTTLDLNWNQISNDGVETLCQTLQKAHCQVTTLRLSGNSQITIVGKRRLKNVLKRKPHLKLFGFPEDT
ncbi:NACHT, LRR and PYD domains-containing protein 3-like [Stylophora pistillata]|uniref:NACHT, LRR and PYD domains-containing protein 3-like n=1 Tax=Stylophora pistillata TaxID=50429 RepID=UPI000C040AF7|nr:NACHT, LRR and PYD domains-containing protein 3-like [Stylophora pistillata]